MVRRSVRAALLYQPGGYNRACCFNATEKPHTLPKPKHPPPPASASTPHLELILLVGVGVVTVQHLPVAHLHEMCKL